MRSKDDLTRAVILREAGYTLSSVCEKTGLSPSTCYRHFKSLDVARGALSKDTLKTAKQRLLADAGLIGDLKHAIASQINDDLALARSIREGLALALEGLIDDDDTPSALKSRSYAALAVTLKTTSDLMRRCLQIDDGGILAVAELPQLVIRKMSESEIKEVQLAAGAGDD